jgi:hypothetical protein
MNNDSIVECLQKEQRDLQATSFAFFDIVFTVDIASELIALFRTLHQQKRTLVELGFYFCPGNDCIHQVLQVAVDLDLFWNYHIKGTWNQRVANGNIGGNAVPSLSLRPFGFPLQVCYNLRRLQLSCLALTTEDVQVLRPGLDDTQQDEETSIVAPPRYGTRREAPQYKPEYHRYEGSKRRKRRFDSFSISNSTFQQFALEEFCVALRHNKCLQSLALVSCGLNDEDIACTIAALLHHPSLRTLRLYGNQCHRRGCEALVSWLSQPDCRLESLQICNENVSSTPHSRSWLIAEADADATASQSAVHRLQHPERLQLRCFAHNNWPTLDTAEANVDMRYNTSLKQLQLNGNNFDDDDMKHIGALLQRFTALKELDLDSNMITDKGLASFANCSSTGSQLRTLRLSRNMLTPQASHSLLRILTTHPQLDSVTSNDFWKKHTCEPRIRHLLDINSAGRVLLQNNDSSNATKKRHHHGIQCNHKPVPLALWPVVCARVNRGAPMSHLNFGCSDQKKAANGIYFLVRHGPALFEQNMKRNCKQRRDKISSISLESALGMIEDPNRNNAESSLHPDMTTTTS